ncbi:hemagglutinin domain-containing protein [Synechococcus phage S-N03]|uniref:Hemagglutinin domain-containing protein n=1 Tax=Synechococcus phage S-N03 TaxID=2718943 RepID=A0A6G8R5L6_9CAUD|nr:hemagglutinin [Synechococcus phage S-N03]QIN96707.1 hemagglutinin domain-containing protein [Synechococcus phage S-N03]
MSKPITFHKDRVFRETDGVHFSDVFVPGQNGLDLVIHRKFAISPPNLEGTNEKRFYIHYHQTDNNRCIEGRRVFELIATKGQMQHQHYIVLLDDNIGALEILPEVYHRSVSCEEGSILLNHAVRDAEYCESKEFNPTSPTDDPLMREILIRNKPCFVNFTREQRDYYLTKGKVPMF